MVTSDRINHFLGKPFLFGNKLLFSSLNSESNSKEGYGPFNFLIGVSFNIERLQNSLSISLDPWDIKS